MIGPKKESNIPKQLFDGKYQILLKQSLQRKPLLDLYKSPQRWAISQKSLFLAKIYVSTGST